MRTTSVAFLAVGKFTISRGLRYPAALSPREPLHPQTLPPVEIDANSRFFTDCYHDGSPHNLCPLSTGSDRASQAFCTTAPRRIPEARTKYKGPPTRAAPAAPATKGASLIGLSAQEGWNVELILLALHIGHIGLPAKWVERLMGGALGIF
jgi:hypothetical protein